MFEVTCPICNDTREVGIWKKKWGDGPPYIKPCKICCQKGKVESQETRNKKSLALLGVPKPPEYAERMKLRHETDPSLKENLVPGAGAGHNKGVPSGPMPEEIKQKISESMRGKNTK